MTKTDVFKLDRAPVEYEIFRIWTFEHLGLCLEHVEQILYIHRGLGDFAEQLSHMKQRASQLHEVGLYQYEISRRHHSVHDIVGSHEKVHCKARRVDDSLPNIELRK